MRRTRVRRSAWTARRGLPLLTCDRARCATAISVCTLSSVFGLELIEQGKCACLATSEPFSYQAFIEYVPVALLKACVRQQAFAGSAGLPAGEVGRRPVTVGAPGVGASVNDSERPSDVIVMATVTVCARDL